MERATLARPYAKAIFELALQQDALQAWSDILKLVAMVVKNPQMQNLLDHPKVSNADKVTLISDICSDIMTPLGKNLLAVLADYNRLALLPEIARQYSKLRRDHENMLRVEVFSSAPLSKQQQELLAKVLAKRLQREIIISCKVKPELIGGMIIRADDLDLVIDASVKGKLARLHQAMLA